MRWLQSSSSSALRSIIFLNLGIFVFIQILFYAPSNGAEIILLQLTRSGLVNLLFGQFVHFSLFHILFNMIALTSVSQLALNRLSERDFVYTYLASGLIGSLTHYLFYSVPTIGASGSVSGIICFFAVYYHNRSFRFLFFFILPMTVTGFWLAVGFFLLNALGVLFGSAGISFWAHIGGGLCGTAVALHFLKIDRRLRWRQRWW